jgi:hypothetical protein
MRLRPWPVLGMSFTHRIALQQDPDNASALARSLLAPGPPCSTWATSQSPAPVSSRSCSLAAQRLPRLVPHDSVLLQADPAGDQVRDPGAVRARRAARPGRRVREQAPARERALGRRRDEQARLAPERAHEPRRGAHRVHGASPCLASWGTGELTRRLQRLTVPLVDTFVSDLKQSVQDVKGSPVGEGTMVTLYGTAQLLSHLSRFLLSYFGRTGQLQPRRPLDGRRGGIHLHRHPIQGVRAGTFFSWWLILFS